MGEADSDGQRSDIYISQSEMGRPLQRHARLSTFTSRASNRALAIAAQHCTVVLVIEQPVRQRTLPRLGPSPWWGDTLILDLLDPEEVRTPPIAMKDYSDEFRADSVALYESTLGATYKDIAADLGINRATLREWVLRDRERRGVVPTVPRSGG